MQDSQVAALLALACCGGDPAPAPMPTATAPALDKLTVTLDGKPVAMQRAFALREPTGGVQVYVTNRNGSCSELVDHLFTSSKDTVYVLATLAPRLAPDGTETFVVASLGGRIDNLAPGGTASVTGTADKGSKADVRIDFSATGSGRKLEMHGSFAAEGCGAVDASKGPGVPATPLAGTGTITVANKPFPIRGAIHRGNDFVLLDFPKDCSPATWFMGVRVRLENGTWYLDGSRIGSSQRGLDDPKHPMKLAIAPGATGTNADGPTVELALSGSAQLGDYPVTLDGKVTALDCK